MRTKEPSSQPAVRSPQPVARRISWTGNYSLSHCTRRPSEPKHRCILNLCEKQGRTEVRIESDTVYALSTRFLDSAVWCVWTISRRKMWRSLTHADLATRLKSMRVTSYRATHRKLSFSQACDGISPMINGEKGSNEGNLRYGSGKPCESCGELVPQMSPVVINFDESTRTVPLFPSGANRSAIQTLRASRLTQLVSAGFLGENV